MGASTRLLLIGVTLTALAVALIAALAITEDAADAGQDDFPTCQRMSTVTGPPRFEQWTMQDSQSGLNVPVEITRLDNATVIPENSPPATDGTTGPVYLKFLQIDTQLGYQVDFVPRDKLNYGINCTTDDGGPACPRGQTTATKVEWNVYDISPGLTSIAEYVQGTNNATFDIPVFTPGTDELVLVTANKTNPDQLMTATLIATDANGAIEYCSYVEEASPTPTPTPTPTATPGLPCPGEPSPPGGTCPPCPTFSGIQANDVGVLSTCPAIVSPTPTPTPTAVGPACPAATAPPGGTCPPCPTFNVQVNDVGVESTCAPSPTPTPTVTPGCPTPLPTGNCGNTPTFTPNPSCPVTVNDIGVQCTGIPTPTPCTGQPDCPSGTPTITPFPYLRGDADCSTVVDLLDILATLDFLSTLTFEPFCSDNADYDCAQSLTVFDALLNLIVQAGLPLPTPTPVCPN